MEQLKQCACIYSGGKESGRDFFEGHVGYGRRIEWQPWMNLMIPYEKMLVLWANLTISINGDMVVRQMMNILVWPYNSTCTIYCTKHVVRYCLTHGLGLFP